MTRRKPKNGPQRRRRRRFSPLCILILAAWAAAGIAQSGGVTNRDGLVEATFNGPVYRTRVVPYLQLCFARRDGQLRIVHLLLDD